MRRPALLAVLLTTACASAPQGAPPPGGPIVEVRKASSRSSGPQL